MIDVVKKSFDVTLNIPFGTTKGFCNLFKSSVAAPLRSKAM